MSATNQLIENHKTTLIVLNSEKCYMPMFKYAGGNWCYSLPIRNMYLMSLDEANKSIELQKIDNDKKKFKCEYKIAKIVN